MWHMSVGDKNTVLIADVYVEMHVWKNQPGGGYTDQA